MKHAGVARGAARWASMAAMKESAVRSASRCRRVARLASSAAGSSGGDGVSKDPEIRSLRFATRVMSHPRVHEGALRAVTTPIVPATTFHLPSCAAGARLCLADSPEPGEDGFLYGRWGSPTTDVAARVIRDLEGAEAAFIFGSGMVSARRAPRPGHRQAQWC